MTGARAVTDRATGGRTVLLLRVGTCLGAFGVGATMLPVASVAFGAPKTFVLAVAATLVLSALALNPRLRSMLALATRRSPIVGAGTALLTLATASTLFALDPRRALLGGYPDYRGLIAVMSFGAIGGGAMLVRRIDRSPALSTRAAALAVLIVSVVALGERLGLPPAGLKPPGAARFISTLGNASNLGVWLLVVTPLALLAAFSDARPAWRRTAAVASGASVLVLLWTLSRGAWVGALAGLAVAGLVAWRARTHGNAPASRRRSDQTRRVATIAASVLLVAIVLAALTTPQLGARVVSVLGGRLPTLTWRFSTWESSLHMLAERPVLGWGLDNFRYAYPPYQEPGQNDGRNGYIPTESAHNLVMDAGVALGAPGLLATLALVAMCGWAIWRRPRKGAGAPTVAEAVTVSGALGGALVALLPHYVTLDTGTALAALIGIVAAWQPLPEPEASPARHPAAASRLWSPGAIGFRIATAVWAAIAVLALAVLAGSYAAGRAAELAASGAEWDLVAARAARASGLAPWNADLRATAGRAAGVRLQLQSDPNAAAEGVDALQSAQTLAPYDTSIAWDRATLLFMWGAREGDRARLQQALDEYERLGRADPASGQPLAGQGRSLLALARNDEAVELLERAVELSPQYVPAWQDLVTVYDLLGRDKDAERAKATLNELTTESSAYETP